MITSQQILTFAPKTKDPAKLADVLNEVFDRYQINTSRRVRYFMAQSGYETNLYTTWVESLYYTTADRIATVWPTRFHSSSKGRGPLNANNYVRNEELLANEVYSNRMGNGDPSSGDGYRFRGRGAGHLTGRYNYTVYSQKLYGNDTLVNNPDRVAEYYDGCMTFGCFWLMNGLNELADTDDFTIVTGRINGASGTNLKRVVDERLPFLRKSNQVF